MPFRPWLCVSVSRCGKRGGKILKDVSRKAVGRRLRPGSAQRDQAHHVSGEHRYKHRHTEQHTCWEPRSVETWEGEEITSSLVCVPTISHRAGKASGPLEDECAEPPSIYCCCYCCCPSGRSRASRNANSNIRMRNHHQRSGCVLYQNHHHLSDVRSGLWAQLPQELRKLHMHRNWMFEPGLAGKVGLGISYQPTDEKRSPSIFLSTRTKCNLAM